MTRSCRALLGWLVLLGGCSRSSEATPLPEPPAPAVARAAVEPDAVKPALEIAAPPSARPATVPATFTQDVKKSEAAAEPRPKDRGGKLMDELLQPVDGALPLFVSKPHPLTAAPFLEKPTLKSQPFQPKAPRLAVSSAAKPPRPRPVPEGMPLYSQRQSPRPPLSIQLPAGSLLQWPAPNTDELPALPTLASQQPDRASLADPTVEVSTTAALRDITPARTSMAPFVRSNLPNPFEHRETVRLRKPVAEDAAPVR